MLDPGLAPHGIHRYWKSGFTKNIGDALIDASVDAAKDFISPMTAIAFFGIHGAATRVPPDKTAFGLRDAQWDFGVVSQWAEATKSEQQIAWTRQRWGQMEPLVTAGVYVNHIAADDKPERVRASYGPNYDKLVALKNKYDPTNFFRVNQNIRPTARGR
jgi:FAD/FMN-containing dehydrogenase